MRSSVGGWVRKSAIDRPPASGLTIANAAAAGFTSMGIRRALASGKSEVNFLAGAAGDRMALAVRARPIGELHIVRSLARDRLRRATAWGSGRARALGAWVNGQTRRPRPMER